MGGPGIAHAGAAAAAANPNPNPNPQNLPVFAGGHQINPNALNAQQWQQILQQYQAGQISTGNTAPITPAQRNAQQNQPILGNPVLPQNVAGRAVNAGRNQKVPTRAEMARRAMQTRVALQTTNAIARTGIYLADLPRPGGIGLLLFTIIVILFALVPMNSSGDTRITLIWLALRGKVTLPSSNSIDTSPGQSGPSGSLQSAAASAIQGVASRVGAALGSQGAQDVGQAATTAATGGLVVPGANNSALQGVIQGIEIGIGSEVSGLGGLIPYSSGGGQ